jgi:hypothetical protein
MLIWTMFDCRYKLDQVGSSWCELEGAKEKNIGARPHLGAYIGTSRRLDHGPGTYIPFNRLHLGKNSRIPNHEESN